MLTRGFACLLVPHKNRNRAQLVPYLLHSQNCVFDGGMIPVNLLNQSVLGQKVSVPQFIGL